MSRVPLPLLFLHLAYQVAHADIPAHRITVMPGLEDPSQLKPQ